ncbi:hypothetical protein Ahy_B10g105907 isoform B [Arachis hypogaea]|uniref:Uncharacterized protein n=1 Tax=Arachis hypogaea TaxID=3818 RepID=A0A444X941_ARAHY|nr:hypothetical protein Ahy_B10g105907 isoform B [Arachis hypogaea]
MVRPEKRFSKTGTLALQALQSPLFLLTPHSPIPLLSLPPPPFFPPSSSRRVPILRPPSHLVTPPYVASLSSAGAVPSLFQNLGLNKGELNEEDELSDICMKDQLITSN